MCSPRNVPIKGQGKGIPLQVFMPSRQRAKDNLCLLDVFFEVGIPVLTLEEGTRTSSCRVHRDVCAVIDV
jgi:hypothetical protein